MSHSVTSLEKVLGGDRRDLTKAGSGMCRIRRVSDGEERWSHRALRIPMSRTAWAVGRACVRSNVSQKRREVHET